jgi:hypothetical protein
LATRQPLNSTLALIGDLILEENMNDGNDIFWEIAQLSIESLFLNSVYLIVSIAALILFIIGTVQLYRKTRNVGSKYILISLVAYIIGFVSYSIYLIILTDEASDSVDDYLNVYLSTCTLLGTYGYWLLCKTAFNRAKD